MSTKQIGQSLFLIFSGLSTNRRHANANRPHPISCRYYYSVPNCGRFYYIISHSSQLLLYTDRPKHAKAQLARAVYDQARRDVPERMLAS